ncbi:MAG: ligase-associated DNA damage response DEXH box helicase [Burkholderiaceae bacterium]
MERSLPTPQPAGARALPTIGTRRFSQRQARLGLERWLAEHGWQAFRFQRQVWRAMLEARSGLLHASTGAGKTLAVWGGALLRTARLGEPQPMQVLWITPMRALAADTAASIDTIGAAVDPRCRVALRSGDTTPAERRRLDRHPPFALVTTPETLSLMLSQPAAQARLAAIHTVIIDEWHELLGNKRGVQVQLALARLRRLTPGLVVWGVSATLGNLDEAARALGTDAPVLVGARLGKQHRIDTLLPASTERFPWGGHLGIRMLEPVIADIEAHRSTLVFTNTRSQAERWYHELLTRRPDWAGTIALHHGSLDIEVRRWVERALKQGLLRCVVCTSSLDLGVDFSPVERVLQIGSPKGVARLLQRAGRSGHSPGGISRIGIVPTHALELIEAVAARRAARAGRIERRTPPELPMDVLTQHLVTVALGTGFDADALYDEVCSAHSYRSLSRAAFDWALDFVGRGGASLTAYPEYRRVTADEHDRYRVEDAAIARRHRQSIGTIVADAAILVRFMSGARIGTIEESFIARLRRGDRFMFAGRVLELARIEDMTAWVRPAKSKRAAVPRWGGGKMPLSNEMAETMLECMAQIEQGRLHGAETRLLAPLMTLQMRWSALPGPGRLLVEHMHSREGEHLFVHPFAGRLVHTGLAALLAWRVARERPATFSISVNDYGFELLCPEPLDWSERFSPALLDDTDLLDDVLASLNAAELSQRRFREIARISGLVFQGHPGAARSARQLQASASLFFQVFRDHDRDNLLLDQARREVLAQELEIDRLRTALAAMRARELALVTLRRPSPFAFPLMVERFRERLTTEKLGDRIARMLRDLEAQADRDL